MGAIGFDAVAPAQGQRQQDFRGEIPVSDIGGRAMSDTPQILLEHRLSPASWGHHIQPSVFLLYLICISPRILLALPCSVSFLAFLLLSQAARPSPVHIPGRSCATRSLFPTVRLFGMLCPPVLINS